MYVIGNRRIAPLTAKGPIRHTFWATRLETSRMTTKEVVKASRYLYRPTVRLGIGKRSL
jgi:hypothetical protein